jgi:hypothetical protein
LLSRKRLRPEHRNRRGRQPRSSPEHGWRFARPLPASAFPAPASCGPPPRSLHARDAGAPGDDFRVAEVDRRGRTRCPRGQRRGAQCAAACRRPAAQARRHHCQLWGACEARHSLTHGDIKMLRSMRGEPNRTEDRGPMDSVYRLGSDRDLPRLVDAPPLRFLKRLCHGAAPDSPFGWRSRHNVSADAVAMCARNSFCCCASDAPPFLHELQDVQKLLALCRPVGVRGYFPDTRPAPSTATITNSGTLSIAVGWSGYTARERRGLNFLSDICNEKTSLVAS